jgi:hypothetical protein
MSTSTPILQGGNIENLLAPATDAAGRTGTYKSLKNALRASIVFKVNQGNSATILVTPLQATAVAGTGSKALTNDVPIFVKDSDAAGVWTRVANGKNYTTSAGTTIKYVRFDIDPALALDVAGGFDCITVSTGASNVGNITSADLVIGPVRYAEDLPVPAIAD